MIFFFLAKNISYYYQTKTKQYKNNKLAKLQQATNHPTPTESIPISAKRKETIEKYDRHSLVLRKLFCILFG